MNSAFFQKKYGDFLYIEDPQEFHHLINVLRTKKGERVRLIDGKGCEYVAVLSLIDKKNKRAEAKVIECLLKKRELPFKITLAFSPLEDERANEFVVQKGTELGVSEFVPVLCERTIKTNLRLERWSKIIKEAVKQSGRSVIPEVRSLVSLDDFIRACSANCKLFGLIDGDSILVEKITGDVAIVIGPEGDFTPKEVEKLKEAKFKGVGLTKTILKAETAAILLSGYVSLAGGTL
ncbi:MAG: RsmE family RNA methyltransferase [candidate division WOR-3 bacterium]